MRIMGSRSANLYKRSLAAKQLEAYADLCEVMEEFSALRAEHAKKQARLAGFDEILSDGKAPKQPNLVDSLMKKYIPYAVENGTSFLTDPDFIAKETDGLSEAEFDRLSECFRKYSHFSDIHSSFRDAEAAFNNCVANKKGELVIRKKELKAYQEAVKAGRFSKAVSKFESNFEKHSRTYIGHEHYKIATKSLARIALTHPEMVDRESFKRITPGTYDANIKGVYREKAKDPKKTYEALSEYEDATPGKLKEALYTHTLGTRFTGDKKTIRKTITTILLIAALSGAVIPSVQYANEYNSINIHNAESKGYDLLISQNTKDQLALARKTLENFESATEFPSYTEIENLNNLIDGNMDLIVEDLVVNAISESKPDWKVNKVDHTYNRYDGINDDITFEYIDEDGNTNTMVVKKFNNSSFLNNLMLALDGKLTNTNEIFDAEMTYDAFEDLLKEYSNSENISEKSEIFSAILDDLRTKLEYQEIIAAKGMIFNKGLFRSDQFLSFISTDSFSLNLSNKKEIQEAAGKTTDNTSTVKDTGGREFDD